MGKKVIRLTEEQFQTMLTDMITEELLKEGLGEIAKWAIKAGNAVGSLGNGFSSPDKNGKKTNWKKTFKDIWNHLSGDGKHIHDWTKGNKEWYENMTPEQKEAMNKGGSTGTDPNTGERWYKDSSGNLIGGS